MAHISYLICVLSLDPQFPPSRFYLHFFIRFLDRETTAQRQKKLLTSKFNTVRMEEQVERAHRELDQIFTYFYQEQPPDSLPSCAASCSSVLAPIPIVQPRVLSLDDLPTESHAFVPALNETSPPLSPPRARRSFHQQELHNYNERHRTELVRRRFDSLRYVLPFDPQKPIPTRLNILDVATRYIKLLEAVLRSEQSGQNISQLYDQKGLRHTAIYIADHVRADNQRLLDEFCAWTRSRQPKPRYDKQVK